MSNVKAEVKTITPEIAVDYLSRNVRNRTVNERRVTAYAQAMMGGSWKVNAEAIKIDESGKLIDGQHRLYAIIKSNCAIQSLVVTGIECGTEDTIDTGKTRSASDVLGMKTEITPAWQSAVAGAIKMLILYEDGGNYANMTGHKSLSRATNSKILSYYKAHSVEINSAVEFISNSSMKKRGVPATRVELIFYYIVTSRKDRAMADDFMRKVFVGGGLVEGSVHHTIREMLLRYKSKALKISTDRVRLSVIKAWNLYRSGATSVTSQRVTFKPGVDSIPFAK